MTDFPPPTGSVPQLVDRSGQTYPIGESRWQGDDGSPLMVSALPGIVASDIHSAERSQWRYRAALPLSFPNPVSLGEGCAPLLRVTQGGVPLRVKPEWFNPTASFKDRGMSVLVSLLAEQGVTRILEDSSGNAGSSLAAYAAAAGMNARILAPAETSAAKIMQSRFHGAEVSLIPGDRTATSKAAVVESATRFYASHNWHPFFIQGTKLLAYELWEDLDFTAPDAVVVPAGSGSLVLGCFIGFSELVTSGAIEKIPRILVAQAANCSPLADAFDRGLSEVRDVAWLPTMAEGASIARPVRDVEVLAAVRLSGGGFQTITEDELGLEVHNLALSGLYSEPTGALSSAAVAGFIRQGLLNPAETNVIVLTGSGLKSSQMMANVLQL
jgi:threonine synthase